MIWVMGVFLLLIGAILAMPSNILGGIILFGLCVWGLMAGPWWVIIISVLFLIGLFLNIFGEA